MWDFFKVSQEPPDNNVTATKKTRSVYNNESLHEDQVIMKFTWKNLSNNQSNGIKETNGHGDIINENYYPHERNLGTVFEKFVKNFWFPVWKCCWDLLSYNDSCCIDWALLNISGSYWALLSFSENYWELLSITKICWVLLSQIDNCWALMSQMLSIP